MSLFFTSFLREIEADKGRVDDEDDGKRRNGILFLSRTRERKQDKRSSSFPSSFSCPLHPSSNHSMNRCFGWKRCLFGFHSSAIPSHLTHVDPCLKNVQRVRFSKKKEISNPIPTRFLSSFLLSFMSVVEHTRNINNQQESHLSSSSRPQTDGK